MTNAKGQSPHCQNRPEIDYVFRLRVQMAITRVKLAGGETRHSKNTIGIASLFGGFFLRSAYANYRYQAPRRTEVLSAGQMRKQEPQRRN